jgi:hypothetical protein
MVDSPSKMKEGEDLNIQRELKREAGPAQCEGRRLLPERAHAKARPTEFMEASAEVDDTRGKVCSNSFTFFFC